MQQILALRFQCEEVGKHVAGSKKRYTWQFKLKEKMHTIILDFSFISGKLKVTVDRKILLENQLPSNVSFQYPFTLDGFALNIIQQGETFELRLNNKAFSHLYTQQKTNSEFKKYQSEIKDIKVDLDQLNTGNKKISLNIGAFGGMNKKKKETSESNGWNAFAGNSSFPNYFGEPESKQAEVPVKQAKEEKKRTNLLDDDESQQTQNTGISHNASLIRESEISSKSDQLLFEFGQATVQSHATGSREQFGNMQQLFQSLNVNSQPQPARNEIDFFAQEPKKKTPVVPELKDSKDLTNILSDNTPNFNFNGSSSAYTTGYPFNGGTNQADLKPFATTNFKASKTGEFDFYLPANQQKVLIHEQNKPAEVSLVNNPLTDININDFNTMQKLFQTNNLNQNDMFNFPPPPQHVSQPQLYQQSQLNQLPTNTANNTNSYNTMQMMFATSNYSDVKGNQSTTQPTATVPLKSDSFDMFSDNKPTSFSTMSGLPTNNAGFDMLNFGTMQVNASKNQPAQFSFGKTKEQGKPAFKKQNPVSNDLI